MAKKLKPEVAELFKLVGVSGAGTYQVNGFGTINLAEVDLEHAKSLVKIGFPLLKAKKKSDSKS